MKPRTPRPRRLPREVTIRVPGSTSNCGAGFDSLGMALSIYNNVTLSRGDWRGARPAAASDSHGVDMADEAAQLFFVRAGVEEIGYTLAIRGEVPMSRGLGSSVTLRAGVVAALNELTGARLTKDDLCSLVTQLEGHPDNATPAVIGGFCVARCDAHTGELLGVLMSQCWSLRGSSMRKSTKNNAAPFITGYARRRKFLSPLNS